jgi:hypothetical protein
MFSTKYFSKGLVRKKRKLLLIFVEIVYDGTPNFQKIVYCPNHWVIITNTQLKVYLHIYPSIIEILENEFEI